MMAKIRKISYSPLAITRVNKPTPSRRYDRNTTPVNRRPPRTTLPVLPRRERRATMMMNVHGLMESANARSTMSNTHKKITPLNKRCT